MEFKVRAKYWKKGARSYGDGNVIHHSPSAAFRFGLEGIIAPGALIAAGIMDRTTNISSIKKVKFSGNVYDGDVLDVEVTPWRIGKGRDYIFTRDGDKIIQMSNVKTGEYSKSPDLINDDKIIHTYGFVPTSGKQKQFVNSLGLRYDGNFPNMYIFATSAPALLSLGGKQGFIGLHASQSFAVHENFSNGPVEVLIGNEEVRKKKDVSFHYFDQQWIQDGVVKASGTALVVPLDSSAVKTSSLLRDRLVDAACAIGADKYFDMKRFYDAGDKKIA